jgi:DNA replication protein DnaC
MLSDTITDKLVSFKLRGFLEAYREQQESPHYRDLSFEERFAMLVDREALRRQNLAFQKRIGVAKLRSFSSIDEIDFSAQRNIRKQKILQLAQPSWIEAKHSLVITGPTGVGKTFIASALGFNACKLGFAVRYIKLSDLISELLTARHDGSSHRYHRGLAKVQLLIIDEWLREALPQVHANEILDLIDARFRTASTIFVSQLPVPDWHAAIPNPTLADAILDRIVHDTERMEMQGESMRKVTSTLNRQSKS